MAPLSEPGPSPQLCPNCRVPLPEPTPASCPSCGRALQPRPVWLSILAALGATVFAVAGLGLGAFGAGVELFASSSSGSDTPLIWGCFLGALLCFIAASAILKWMKKPKH